MGYGAGGANGRGQLGLWDVTALVVGAVVGADIYVGSALGARYLGPAALAAWAAGALVAWGVALALARCAMLAPRVGGSYAYAREAFRPAVGFAAGWALWLAEWISLAVFPVALTRYLGVLC
ncbi:MAG: amino acid permease, partial [Bacillota bacterium]|nr:amino acid permease [Bacillota bacterium]